MKEYRCESCGRVHISHDVRILPFCYRCEVFMKTPRRIAMKKYWKKVRNAVVVGVSYVLAAPVYLYYKVKGVKL